MMNKTNIDESQNLQDGTTDSLKKESDSVHVSTRLQRDSETREYTKADTGLSHNLALPPRRTGDIWRLPSEEGQGDLSSIIR